MPPFRSVLPGRAHANPPRSRQVDLQGNGKYAVTQSKHRVSEALMAGPGEELFDFIAQKVRERRAPHRAPPSVRARLTKGEAEWRCHGGAAERRSRREAGRRQRQAGADAEGGGAIRPGAAEKRLALQ